MMKFLEKKMCKKIKGKTSSNKIDECIIPLIKWLNTHDFKTVSSCCGHGKYPMTIIFEWTYNGSVRYFEMFSDV